MILETRHLRLVAAVAEHGTLTRAGRVLHLTQSGLSRQLLDLETKLGLPLFHRLGKRMVPTPAGECLLVAARRTLPQLSDVEEDLRRLAGGRTAILRVSTECYTCYHWLPGVLQRFARRFPQVDVQIVAEATHHPVPALLDGRIDLAIVSNDDHDDRLAYVPLFTDELVALLRPDHPLSAKPFLTAAPEFAAEAAARRLPLKRRCSARLRAGAEPRVHSRLLARPRQTWWDLLGIPTHAPRASASLTAHLTGRGFPEDIAVTPSGARL